MRILLIGQAAFAEQVMARLACAGHEIAAVVCPPERGPKPDPTKAAALARGIPVHQFASLKGAEARDALARRMEIRARDVGVSPRSMSIRDQRSRWGSASRRGSVAFSWRLVMAPAAVLDYVVVHELAHLRAFGHGPGFWAIVGRHVVDAEGARRWLRAHETELRAALD